MLMQNLVVVVVAVVDVVDVVDRFDSFADDVVVQVAEMAVLPVNNLNSEMAVHDSPAVDLQFATYYKPN